MTHQERRPRRLSGLLLAALCLGTASGCLSFVHSLDAPPKEQLVPGDMIPAPARHHVHIFIIHGMDPLDLANLAGLTEYIQALGYPKTHYGQMYHLWGFTDELRRIHKEDPLARFVLIGFSFGANMVRDLANFIKDEDIPIDLIVYLGGNTLDNTVRTQPEHVLHIVNILATGCIWNGTTMDRADNLHYDDVWHFGSPTHAKTRALLSRELAVVAGRVPYIERLPAPTPPELEEAPRPRPYKANKVQQAPEVSADWDFLKSRGPYEEPKPAETAPPGRSITVRRVPFSALP